MSSLKICELEPTKPVSKFASPDKKSLRTDNNNFIVLKNPNQTMGKVLHVPAMPVHLLTLKSNTCPPSSSVSCCSAMLSRGHGKAHALTLISLCHHLFFPSPSSGCSNDLRFYHHDVAENNGRFLIYGTLTRRAMIRCHCIHHPFTTDDHR